MNKNLVFPLIAGFLLQLNSAFAKEPVESQSIVMSPETLLIHYALIEPVSFQGKDAIHLQNTPAKPNAAVAFIKDFEFTDGILEIDIASERFAGIAFRASDADHFNKIYFRPFNSGTAKHQNSMQYTVQGFDEWEWKPLRENFPGKYEAGVELPVMKWFHAKFVIRGKEMKVYVNGAENPALTVNPLLFENSKGAIGIWGWNAYFANLKWTPINSQ